MKKFNSILILLILPIFIVSQKHLLTEANELFNMGNYMNAKVKYRLYLTENPNHKIALKQIGLCYLLSNYNKSRAISYFEQCLEIKKPDKEIWFYLADAYIHKMDFEKALIALENYSKKPGKFKKEIPAIRNQINVSMNLINNPVSVKFENLGKYVNSDFPDYYPFIDKNEKVLVFTSQRPKNKGYVFIDGFYPSDVYTSRFNGFTFGKSKNAKSLNSNYSDECVGIQDDGKYIFTIINNYNASERGNIFKSKRKGSTYKRKERIVSSMNSPKYYESSGTIAHAQDLIFFSSNRPEGKGGFDLYIIQKLPNGEWSEPKSIEAINTELDEEYPYYNTSDSCLYFSSNGLPGMGGYDLYKTKWNPLTKTWKPPENLGYPINSSYDDKTICFSNKNDHAYISAVRKGGFGNYDIYRLTFPEHQIKPALYRIQVLNEETSLKIDSVEIQILNDNNIIIGKYKPNENTGIFSVILDPGHYQIKIKAPNYIPLYKKLNVSEFAADKELIKLTYKLPKPAP